MKKYTLFIIGLFFIIAGISQNIPYLKGVRQYYYLKGNNQNLHFNYYAIAEPTVQVEDTVGFTSADYYVSSTGSDVADGQTPETAWRTVGKVQTELTAGTFISGDTIAFRRDDFFTGILSFDGDVGITIGSYENGQKPIISNIDTVVEAWVESRSNIWAVHLNNPDDYMYFLKVNERQHVIGRYPNNDDRDTISGYNSTSSVYDFSRNDPDDYWNGGMLWCGNEDWTRGFREILDWTQSTQTFTLTQAFQNGFYANNGDSTHFYVISNHWRTLDQNYEWTFDEDVDSLYIYASNFDPNDSVITYSRDGNIITVASNCSNITIDGVNLQMTNDDGVNATGTASNYYSLGVSNVEVKNSTIKYTGDYGIQFINTNNGLIYNNTIDYNLWGGVRLGHDSITVVRDNIITNINMHPGEREFDATGRGIALIFEYINGLFQGCYGSKVYRNKLTNIGSSGITFGRCNAVVVDSNYVENASVWLSDYGGGIYQAYNSTFYWRGSGWPNNWEGSYVRNNFVDLRETYDNNLGRNVATEAYQAVHGIYSDNYSCQVTISGNVVLGGRNAYLCHWNDSLTINNNIGINDNRYAFYLSGRGRGYSVNNNTFISPWDGVTAVDNNPRVLNPANSETLPGDPNFSSQGQIFNGNYVLLPNNNYSNNGVFTTYNGGESDGAESYSNIATWNAESWAGTDYTDVIGYGNTSLSTIDSMFHYYYNFSDTVVYLSEIKNNGYAYYHVAGDSVVNDTILPYTGMVWIRSRAGDNDAPVASNVTSGGNLVAGQVLTATYDYSDTESDVQGNTLYRWWRATDDQGTAAALVDGANQQTYTLLITDTLYYFAPEVTPTAVTGSSPGLVVIGTYRGPIADSTVTLGVDLLSGFDLTDANWTEVNCTPIAADSFEIAGTSGGTRITILTPGAQYRLIGNWTEHDGIDVTIATALSDGTLREYILNSPGQVDFTPTASHTDLYIRFSDAEGTLGSSRIITLELREHL